MYCKINTKLGEFQKVATRKSYLPYWSIDLKDSPARRFYYACKPTVKKEQEIY